MADFVQRIGINGANSGKIERFQQHLLRDQTVQGSSISGGTAIKIVCGGAALGRSYCSAMPVVSVALGTTSTHSSMSTPASGWRTSTGEPD